MTPTTWDTALSPNGGVLPAGSGTTDSWGDPFLLVLCLLTLVVRAKSLSERGFTAVLVLALIAKMLLRAQARAAYLRHRVAVVSATRILVMLCASMTPPALTRSLFALCILRGEVLLYCLGSRDPQVSTGPHHVWNAALGFAN